MELRERIDEVRLRKCGLREGTKAREDLDLMIRMYDLQRLLLERMFQAYSDLDEEDANLFDYSDELLMDHVVDMLNLEVDLHPEDCASCGEELDDDVEGVICHECLEDDFCEDCGEKNTECACDEECEDCGYSIADCVCSN